MVFLGTPPTPGHLGILSNLWKTGQDEKPQRPQGRTLCPQKDPPIKEIMEPMGMEEVRKGSYDLKESYWKRLRMKFKSDSALLLTVDKGIQHVRAHGKPLKDSRL